MELKKIHEKIDAVKAEEKLFVKFRHILAKKKEVIRRFDAAERRRESGAKDALVVCLENNYELLCELVDGQLEVVHEEFRLDAVDVGFDGGEEEEEDEQLKAVVQPFGILVKNLNRNLNSQRDVLDL